MWAEGRGRDPEMRASCPRLATSLDVGGDRGGGVGHPWLQVRFEGTGWSMFSLTEKPNQSRLHGGAAGRGSCFI